jgi:hypothetical protein
MHGSILAALIVTAIPQLPATAPDAPPIVDVALRTVRAASGGSSIARSAARGDRPVFLYAGLGPCPVGASYEDRAHQNTLTWRASGRVRSIERGIAVADVEWQRLEYRPAGIVAGPRVRTTLTLPLGERVAVDFVDVSGSACRMDGLIFEIGVAPDHGRTLAMSSEGRSASSGGRGGGGVGRPIDAAQTERQRQGADAARAAAVVTRPMPAREYNVDLWLVPEAPASSSTPALAQRLSQAIGGTGGRFTFPPISVEATGQPSVTVEVSALVIPVGGDQLIVAITRHVTPGNDASPVSAGWLEAVPFPNSDAVLSFEIPVPGTSEPAMVPRQGYGLRLRIAHR